MIRVIGLPFIRWWYRLLTVGAEQVPEQGGVLLVANHVSYVDGFLLKGYLPRRFSFVIKGEFRDVPVASWLLKRAGSRAFGITGTPPAASPSPRTGRRASIRTPSTCATPEFVK